MLEKKQAGVVGHCHEPGTASGDGENSGRGNAQVNITPHVCTVRVQG